MAKKKKVTRKKSASPNKGSTSNAGDTQQMGMRSDLPLHWIDSMRVTVREPAHLATLRFFSGLEEGHFEACRIQLPVDGLKNIVELLCRTLDYYPSKPKP
jgi:hypothetical protein